MAAGPYLLDGRRVRHGLRSGGRDHAEQYELDFRTRTALHNENAWPSQSTRQEEVAMRASRAIGYRTS